MKYFLETPVGAYIFAFFAIFLITIDTSDMLASIAGSAFFAMIGMFFVPIIARFLPDR